MSGHKLRRPNGHVVKRALEWNPQGKQKRGIPPAHLATYENGRVREETSHVE